MHSALWQGDRDMTRELLRYGGAVMMPHPQSAPPAPNGQVAEREPFGMPAGDPIDHASATLKRLLAKQHAASGAEEEDVVRFY